MLIHYDFIKDGHGLEMNFIYFIGIIVKQYIKIVNEIL